MEAVEAMSICLAQDPFHFRIETEVPRWLLSGIHLELLRDRIDALAQNLKQRRKRQLSRQYHAGQQHDPMTSRGADQPTAQTATSYSATGSISLPRFPSLLPELVRALSACLHRFVAFPERNADRSAR